MKSRPKSLPQVDTPTDTTGSDPPSGPIRTGRRRNRVSSSRGRFSRRGVAPNGGNGRIESTNEERRVLVVGNWGGFRHAQREESSRSRGRRGIQFTHGTQPSSLKARWARVRDAKCGDSLLTAARTPWRAPAAIYPAHEAGWLRPSQPRQRAGGTNRRRTARVRATRDPAARAAKH